MIAALGLTVVFSFGVSWLFTTLGLLMRSPSAVMNAGFMFIFPLTFLSNAFVEPETLPSVLEAFVNVNPISIMTNAARGLMARRRGRQRRRDLARRRRRADAVFMPLTSHLYRTRG